MELTKEQQVFYQSARERCRQEVDEMNHTIRTEWTRLNDEIKRVQELIQQKRIEELKSAMGKGGSEGMQTFDQSLLDLVNERVIDEEVAIKFADSANDLKLRLRGIGGSGLS